MRKYSLHWFCCLKVVVTSNLFIFISEEMLWKCIFNVCRLKNHHNGIQQCNLNRLYFHPSEPCFHSCLIKYGVYLEKKVHKSPELNQVNQMQLNRRNEHSWANSVNNATASYSLTTLPPLTICTVYITSHCGHIILNCANCCNQPYTPIRKYGVVNIFGEF